MSEEPEFDNELQRLVYLRTGKMVDPVLSRVILRWYEQQRSEELAKSIIGEEPLKASEDMRKMLYERYNIKK